MKRALLTFMALAALVVPLAGANAGNGAPSGSHYNLNIIGVPKGKTADMTGTSGHTIFVNLSGNTKILLQQGDDFLVIDRNGTDANGATFQLPDPVDTCTTVDGITTTCTTNYSVFARAPGNSGGSANLTTCATDPATGERVCSVQVLEIKQSSKFQNVTKYLLFVFWDTDGDGVANNLIPIFDNRLEGYFWSYDNNGLKLLQLRFYPCQTTVNLDGSWSDSCGRTGR